METRNKCLLFLNHRKKADKITSLKYEVQSSIINKPFVHSNPRFSKEIQKYSKHKWEEIKKKILKKFSSRLTIKRPYTRKAIYDINDSKLTKIQLKSMKYRETILRLYNDGWDHNDFKLRFGKSYLPRIKRIVYTEMLRDKKEPIEVILRRPKKVLDKHIQEIIKIANGEEFIGGCKKIKEILANQPNEDIRIDLSKNTISKILRRKKFFYKNLKIRKRTCHPKQIPS